MKTYKEFTEFFTPTLPRLSKSEQERKKKGIPKDKQGKGFQLDTSDDDDDDNKRKSGIMFNQLKVEDRVADAIKARGEKPNIKTRGQQAKRDREDILHQGGIPYRDRHKDHMANAKGHPAEPGQSGAGENDPRRYKRKPPEHDNPHRGTGKNYDKEPTISDIADSGRSARDDHKNWGPDYKGKGQNSVQHGTADPMKKSEKSDLAKKLKQPFKPKKESVGPVGVREGFDLGSDGLSSGKLGGLRTN